MRKKILIIGGGLAGLSAAYYLSKDQDFEVTLAEASSRLGGRVLSKNVNGIDVELGGFMIFPWYKYVRKLISELGLSEKLKSFTSNQQFYEQDGRYLDKKTQEEKIYSIRLLSHWIAPFLLGKTDFYNTNLDLYKGKTTKEVFDQWNIQDSNIMDMLMEAYTYPDLGELPATIFSSFATELITKGRFDRCEYLEGGMSSLVNCLEGEIKKNGGQILMSLPVTSVESLTATFTNGEIFEADVILFALPLDHDLYPKILQEKIDFNYTKHYTLAVELESDVIINENKDWFICYDPLTHEAKNPCIVSMVFLAAWNPVIDNAHKELLVNIHLHPEDMKEYSDEELQDIIQTKIKTLLPSNNVKKVLATVRWDKTMPSVPIKTLKIFREKQGKNSYYFAGDYLGPPCMETAVYTGSHIKELFKKK